MERADRQDPRARRRRRTDGQRLDPTPGEAGDAPGAAIRHESLAPSAAPSAHPAQDPDAIRRLAAERGAWAKILPRSLREGGFAVSTRVPQQENPVVRFSGQAEQFRGRLLRYDRGPEKDLAAFRA